MTSHFARAYLFRDLKPAQYSPVCCAGVTQRSNSANYKGLSYLFLPFSSSSLLTAWLPGLSHPSAACCSGGRAPAALGEGRAQPRSLRAWIPSLHARLGQPHLNFSSFVVTYILVGGKKKQPAASRPFLVGGAASPSHQRRGSTSGGRRPPRPRRPPGSGAGWARPRLLTSWLGRGRRGGTRDLRPPLRCGGGAEALPSLLAPPTFKSSSGLSCCDSALSDNLTRSYRSAGCENVHLQSCEELLEAVCEQRGVGV